jgi:hypothetical protein
MDAKINVSSHRGCGRVEEDIFDKYLDFRFDKFTGDIPGFQRNRILISHLMPFKILIFIPFLLASGAAGVHHNVSRYLPR